MACNLRGDGIHSVLAALAGKGVAVPGIHHQSARAAMRQIRATKVNLGRAAYILCRNASDRCTFVERDIT
jgi:hypothetical protein